MDWKPIRPLKWLGEWLKKNSDTGREQARVEEAAAEEARPKAFSELSREQKLHSTFQAVDVDGSGSLDMDEMLAICRKMNPGKGVEEAHSQISWMDQDGDGQVDQAEFTKAMLELMVGAGAGASSP